MTGGVALLDLATLSMNYGAQNRYARIFWARQILGECSKDHYDLYLGKNERYTV
jgi:hypothetical protein